MYAYSCLCVIAYNQGLACGPAILWRVYTLFWLAMYNTHKMLFESLILGITNKNLRPNKSSLYSIIDKPQALLPAKNEIMHEFEFCVPLLYKYPYMCVISTYLLYLLVHDVVSILYMILCPFFEKKRKKKMEKKERKKKKLRDFFLM